MEITLYQVFMIGFAIFNLLLAIMYWPLISKQKDLQSDIKELSASLSAFKLAVTKDYTSKNEMMERLKAQGDQLQELKSLLRMKFE